METRRRASKCREEQPRDDSAACPRQSTFSLTHRRLHDSAGFHLDILTVPTRSSTPNATGRVHTAAPLILAPAFSNQSAAACWQKMPPERRALSVVSLHWLESRRRGFGSRQARATRSSAVACKERATTREPKRTAARRHRGDKAHSGRGRATQPGWPVPACVRTGVSGRGSVHTTDARGGSRRQGSADSRSHSGTTRSDNRREAVVERLRQNLGLNQEQLENLELKLEENTVVVSGSVPNQQLATRIREELRAIDGIDSVRFDL